MNETQLCDVLNKAAQNDMAKATNELIEAAGRIAKAHGIEGAGGFSAGETLGRIVYAQQTALSADACSAIARRKLNELLSNQGAPRVKGKS